MHLGTFQLTCFRICEDASLTSTKLFTVSIYIGIESAVSWLCNFVFGLFVFWGEGAFYFFLPCFGFVCFRLRFVLRSPSPPGCRLRGRFGPIFHPLAKLVFKFAMAFRRVWWVQLGMSPSPLFKHFYTCKFRLRSIPSPTTRRAQS